MNGPGPATRPDPAQRAGRFMRSGGRYAWAFVGLCIAGAIVASVLALASSVVLPLFFAVVLAILFRPPVRWLQEHRVPRSLASGLVVLALVLGSVAFAWVVVVGIVREADAIISQVNAALTEVGVDQPAADSVSDAVASLEPATTTGFLEALVSGIDMLVGVVAGVILGILIMYYMLKEGGSFLRTVESRMMPGRAAQFGFLASDATIVMRKYWLGRTVVAAVVGAVVGLGALLMGLPMVLTLAAVTFVGGYIPYIGAFIGGLLAVLVAVAEKGVGAGLVMLLIVLVANLLVENMVDPHVTGRTLRIHPLVVLLVTTMGGVLGGLVGLMMAVPITVIAVRAVGYFRAAFEIDTDAVRDALRRTV